MHIANLIAHDTRLHTQHVLAFDSISISLPTLNALDSWKTVNRNHLLSSLEHNPKKVFGNHQHKSQFNQLNIREERTENILKYVCEIPPSKYLIVVGV